jgi:uncharacterized protein (TIGR03032 family)
MSADAKPEEESASTLRYEATDGFVKVLDRIGCSLAVSVYTQNKVVLIGATAGALHINAFDFVRPMGMATANVNGEVRLAVATFDELVILADAPLLAARLPGREGEFDHLLVPRAVLFTGDIDAHDLVWAQHNLLAANTRFSCIAEIDVRASFVPVWTPPFVTQLMPEDRCHFNGLAVDGAKVAYATAFGPYDEPRGWSQTRFTSGILMEVPSGRPVLDRLCMPHSPRVFDGQLYVLDSGTGRVLRVDPKQKTADALCDLPGFARGFDRYGDVLFVGLSRIRTGQQTVPPVAAKHEELVCGIVALERQSGRILGYLRFDRSYEEVFDIKVLPNFRRAGLLSTTDTGHRRALVLPGRAFWGEERK